MAARREKPMDYLEPFLEQLNLPADVKLTRQQALKLRDDVLNDLKQRLVDQANLIQASFDKVPTSTPFMTLTAISTASLHLILTFFIHLLKSVF